MKKAIYDLYLSKIAKITKKNLFMSNYVCYSILIIRDTIEFQFLSVFSDGILGDTYLLPVYWLISSELSFHHISFYHFDVLIFKLNYYTIYTWMLLCKWVMMLTKLRIARAKVLKFFDFFRVKGWKKTLIYIEILCFKFQIA